jgi:hypothetical protein
MVLTLGSPPEKGEKKKTMSVDDGNLGRKEKKKNPIRR